MEEEERESLLMNRQGENEERMDDEVFGGIFMLLEWDHGKISGISCLLRDKDEWHEIRMVNYEFNDENVNLLLISQDW